MDDDYDDGYVTGNEPRVPQGCTCYRGYCNAPEDEHSMGGSMS